MSWFKREKVSLAPAEGRRLQMPEGVWRKCDACKEVLYAKAIAQNGQACPRCDFHFPISVDERLALLMDRGSVREIGRGLRSLDPLGFRDQVPYLERLKKHAARTGREEAVVVVEATILGHAIVACIMDFEFMGGSLGSVVGEKIARGVEHARETRRPLIIVCASGGARMQEGALSLMQMAKVNSALARLGDAGLPYIAILTNPTTGGVTASFAMVGDVILAEPGALIGFAGPRVIEQTIRQTLPDGFQRSEFLLEHGMLDRVVPRRDMREVLGRCLSFFTGQKSRPVEVAPSAGDAETEGGVGASGSPESRTSRAGGNGRDASLAPRRAAAPQAATQPPPPGPSGSSHHAAR